MGLDFVEFILSVEQRFGFDFPDEDAGLLRTPRELIDYLTRRLGALPVAVSCRSQRAFYRVRSTLTAALDLPRSAVAPSTRLDDLMPARSARAATWQELATALRGIGACPPLVRPIWLRGAIAALVAAAGATTLITLRHDLGLAWAGVITVCTVTAWVSVFATRQQATDFASRITIRDLVETAVRSESRLAPTRDRHWTRDAVKLAVYEVAAKRLGLVEFSEDAEWLRDLGVD